MNSSVIHLKIQIRNKCVINLRCEIAENPQADSIKRVDRKTRVILRVTNGCVINLRCEIAENPQADSILNQKNYKS